MRLQPIKHSEREHIFSIDSRPILPPLATVLELVNFLPGSGGESFRKVVEAIVRSVGNKNSVVMAFGAHVIKTGCSPYVIDLVDRGIVHALACNGACAIHDIELALWGATSENVNKSILDGTFGMVKETWDFFDKASDLAQNQRIGFGNAIGILLADINPPYIDHSIFAKMHKEGLPITVHVAIGTDTVHMSPGLNGDALGEASLRDFHILCKVVENLNGGVWMNVGSAVILPEVFLKTVAMARNIGIKLDDVTTVNFDMIRQYRSTQNVVNRPMPGRGIEIIGQHEILIPLLWQAIISRQEVLERENGNGS